MSDDAPMLDRIGDAFDHDLAPVPSHLLGAARDAFAWRLADAQLAELLFDSANDELVGVRGAATDRRSFRFGADDFVIRVHLTDATMVVMIEPPLSVTCRIASESGEHRTDEHRTDELGELVVDAPALPVRIEVDLPSGTFATPWITG
jgi:hypothetical protein